MPKVKLFRMSPCQAWEEACIGELSLTLSHLTIWRDPEHTVFLTTSLQDSNFYRQHESLLHCICPEHYIIHFDEPAELKSVWREVSKSKGLPDSLLPEPTITSITSIQSILETSDIQEVIEQNNIEEFMANLSKAFLIAEVSKHEFFVVFQILINSCNETVIKEVLALKNFEAVVKILACDPEAQDNKFDYLASKFKNVLNVGDESFVELAQMNFRLGFLKEAVRSRSFEERVVVILASFQTFVNEEIIKKFIGTSDIRAGLIIELVKRNEEALVFLKELIALSKVVLAPNLKVILFETIYEDEVLEKFLGLWDCSDETKRIIICIIYDMFQIMPWNFKKLMLTDFNGDCCFFEQFVRDSIDMDIEQVQIIGEFLKTLLETSKSLEFSEILDMFFEKVVYVFQGKLKNKDQSDFSKCEILGILGNCLQSEPVASRFDFVLSGLLDTVAALLDTECSATRIAVYKFYRLVVKSKDSYLLSHFITLKYFSKAFEELKECQAKENMMFSCILSLLSEISINDSFDLLIHVHDSYKEMFESSSISRYFEKIKQKLDSSNQLPVLKSSFSSIDFIANENLFDVPTMIKPSKRPDTLALEPTKKMKLN